MNCCDANGDCREGPGCCCREDAKNAAEAFKGEQGGPGTNLLFFLLASLLSAVSMVAIVIFGLTQ